jgi:Tol biopolymer transport system component
MHRSAVLILAILLASCALTSPPAGSGEGSATPAGSVPPSTIPSSVATPSPAVTPLASPVPTGLGPTAGQLAYVSGVDPQIHLLDLATGESRQLTHLLPEHAELTALGLMRPALTCGFGPYGLTWSPDGDMLAFSYGSCDSVVYVVDLEGELRRIGDGRAPAWSPDGTRLVHAVNVPWSPCGAGCQPEPDPGEWDLRIIDLSQEGESEPLTVDGSTAAAGSPTWSRDGSTIAYNAPPPADPGQQEIVFSATYVIDGSGGGRRLVRVGTYPIGWHPDGRLLIQGEDDSSVHTIDLATGDSAPIAPAQTSTVSPDTSLFVTWAVDPVTAGTRSILVDSEGRTLADFRGHAMAWAPDSSLLAALDGTSMLIVGRDGSLLATFPIEQGGGGGSAAWRPGT